ncbi:hypothetical protein OHV05_10125 [Kitasatospora sp. NBC_00070]|uniref:hypothetical protein n=1 Tax=Kitasatospora sp. NBC_00070 TaxID=2975962 RepID=UPI003252C92A
MAPQPLPHPNDDPAFAKARQSVQAYTAAAASIRGDFNITDVAKAEGITTIHGEHVKQVQAAFDDLTRRRRTRLEYLETLVPVGPGIPEGTSPADKAVLMTAFRNAYAAAQDARTPADRQTLLAQAERFDDDAMRRAVLTVVIENSETDTLRTWTDQHLTTGGYLAEVIELREALAGRGQIHLWNAQTFRPAPRPQEAAELPGLIAARAAAQRAAIRNPNVKAGRILPRGITETRIA